MASVSREKIRGARLDEDALDAPGVRAPHVSGEPMKNNTFVNHPPPAELPADNRPLVAPIYQSVKFSFDDTDETLRYLKGDRAGFYYSRTSNPTLRQLEQTLARLQGREDCLLVGSGVATRRRAPRYGHRLQSAHMRPVATIDRLPGRRH